MISHELTPLFTTTTTTGSTITLEPFQAERRKAEQERQRMEEEEVRLARCMRCCAGSAVGSAGCCNRWWRAWEHQWFLLNSTGFIQIFAG